MRAGEFARRLVRELSALRALRAELGLERALYERLGAHLDRARQRCASPPASPRARTGPRVLAFNAMFPLLTESYIYDEGCALEEHGAPLAFCRESRSAAPMPIAHPLYEGLADGIARHRPDLLLLHWAAFAQQQLPALEAAGLPFAVRVHSFDFDVALLQKLRAHPLCIGVWAYPHHAALVPGVHALAPLFLTHAALPAPAARRDLVLSVSAGLPKKNWPLLAGALAQVPSSLAERRIVMGVTNEHEVMPGIVASLLAQHRDPPLLQVNLERADVFRLLGRASVLVYTLAPGGNFGNPMSVIEAMAAGACVVLPDRPEARAFKGAHFRGYTDEASLTAQILQVLDGGPAIDAERAQNRRDALARFCAPEHRGRFYDEVTAALSAHRARRAA